MTRAFIVLGVWGATAAWAQHATISRQPMEQGLTLQLARIPDTLPALPGSAATVTGAPYSAEAVTERVQTLADGNRIVQTNSNSVARDSQGRTRRGESLIVALPGDKTSGSKLDMIDDPIAGVHWTLDAQSKTALKLTLPKSGAGPTLITALPPPGPDKTWFFSTGAPGAQITIQTLADRKSEGESNVNRSDLGTQTIEGVSARGSRVTRTLPAGEVGNEQPIVITTETWYSPELKVLIMSKADDPRMGTTTYRLTNIQRGEPSASVFEVPPDYTIKDQPGNVLFRREIRKD